MKSLVFDTETTGLPLFGEPSEDPRQPHIVQLAAMLVDTDTRKVLASLDLIIRPDGWVIPEDVAKIHGITTERAMDEGVSERLAVEMFMELWSRADFRIAHNESFDARILRIALHRFPMAAYPPDFWSGGRCDCTARMATPIMNLPPTERMLAVGRAHPKTPNLQEAFTFFTGANLIDAHSAMADAQACWRVWCAIKDREKLADASAGQAATEFRNEQAIAAAQ